MFPNDDKEEKEDSIRQLSLEDITFLDSHKKKEKTNDINFLDLLVIEKPFEYKLRKYKTRKIPHETMSYEVDDQTRFRNSTTYAKTENVVLQSLCGSTKNTGLRTFIKRRQVEKEMETKYKEVFENERVVQSIERIDFPFDVVDWESNVIYDINEHVEAPSTAETVTKEFVDTILEDNWEKNIIYDLEAQPNFKSYPTMFLEDPNLIFEKLEEKKQNRLKKKHKEYFSGDKPLKNKYNISNDKYYNPEQKTKSSLGTFGVQHSFPALKLDAKFYKTNHTKEELRNFHRPKFYFPLRESITFKSPLKNEILASNIIKKVSELSLKDSSDFALFEYSEEYPFFVVNCGMVSLVNTYYRKSNLRDDYASEQNNLTVLDPEDPSPFCGFGDVKPGFTIKSLTNNLFTAPIFKHSSDDFLCVLESDKDGYYQIYPRKIEDLYCVGQEFPLEEIYAPHSRKLNVFCKNRLKVAAYRLFAMRDKGFKEFRMSQLDEMFPYFSEGSKRKWLKEYADCIKKEKENVWVLKPTCSLLGEEDLRKLVTPENTCQYESMLAGERRLEDYGFKCVGDSEEENEESVHSIPWQLCRNFINASNGRGLLELSGSADPTGIGEAFSFRKIRLTKGNEAENRKIISEHQSKYKDEIERIWNKQLSSLSSSSEIFFDPSYIEDTTNDNKEKKPQDLQTDVNDSSNVIIIKRIYGYGEDEKIEIEKIFDPRVIKLYLKGRKKIKNEDKKILLKCSNCGQTGHMKTNKTCPNFQTAKKPTKKRIESERKKAKVIFQDIMIPLLNSFFAIPYSIAFHKPVSIKKFPDYATVIQSPIDLTTIKTKVRHNKYTIFSDFLDDLELMKDNCMKYNGKEHSLTKIAENIVSLGRAEYENKKKMIEEAERIFMEYDYDETNT